MVAQSRESDEEQASSSVLSSVMQSHSGLSVSGGFRKRKELTGSTFGCLTVTRFAFIKNRRAWWECECVCGRCVTVPGIQLCNGKKRCCGCGKGIQEKEFIGHKFGMLQPISLLPYEGRTVKRKVMCQCDCGNITEVGANDIRTGKTISCGCFAKGRKKHTGTNWQGCGNVPRAYWSRVIYNAESRGLPVNITIQDADNLFVLQAGKCALTGRNIDIHGKHGTASLDRISSEKGYIVGNVQWIHKDLQQMKWDFDQDYFIQTCSEVAYHMSRNRT